MTVMQNTSIVCPATSTGAAAYVRTFRQEHPPRDKVPVRCGLNHGHITKGEQHQLSRRKTSSAASFAAGGRLDLAAPRP